MREFLLYLCGPITGTSYKQSTDWRQYVAGKMPKHITVISPMRGKDYLSQEQQIKSFYDIHPLSTGRGIVCRDRFDVKRSDAVFVNFLGAERVSIMSVMEIAWADAWQKPIIIVAEKENIHLQHIAMKEIAGFIFHDLDKAITIAVAVLSPK